MTDRERLKKIIDKMQDFGVQQCDTYEDEVTHELYTSSENFIKNERIVEELLAECVTFKKKREYIRKLPCKCGAKGSSIALFTNQIGQHQYFCMECRVEGNYARTKKQALIEWNKMNEAKNEN